METKELSVNLNFDSDRFQKLISDFINNDLQSFLDVKLEQFLISVLRLSDMTTDEIRIENDALQEAIISAMSAYHSKTGLTPEIYIDWLNDSTFSGCDVIPLVDVEVGIK